MQHTRRGSSYVLVVLGIILAAMYGYSAYAQETGVEEVMEILPAEQNTPEDPNEFVGAGAQGGFAPPGTVSCFDYYNFGSVQANIAAPISTTVSGTPVAFSGTLENANPYPIVDGALYVKIFRDRGIANDGNGPDVVDQFLVKSDIVIPANGRVPVSFLWNVPSYARTGDYKVATFFATSRKFNLLGLSFTDDVVGNTVNFRVSGEQTTGVGFDKASATVDGKPYYFAAFPPRTPSNAPVEVKATVRNTSNSEENARVLWTIYQWDGQLRENVVQEESVNVKIPARGSAPVAITITDSKYPVYLAVATLVWKDTKSIIGVRFVREGVDRTRINFPSVLSFPLVAGQENTVFSCLHNSGQSAAVPGGRLELTLTDLDGNLIHDYVYEGDVTGAMMGLAENFTPSKTYDRFRLDARLYQNGEFVDEANLVYDCSEINPALCNQDSGTAPGFLGMFGLDEKTVALYATGLAGLFLICFILWAVLRRKETLPPPTF